MPPQASLPSDLTLRVYADGVPAPTGESFLVDNIEVFLTNAAQNASLVRASGTEEPEAYDGVTGIMSIAENNGQGIRAAFTLRNNLYFVKERSLYVTATDGVNEPALWAVEEVSNQVGTPSAHGVGIGEEWVVIAGRSGLYLFDGSEPMKLSQEIQPTWDAINWECGQNLWVQVDTQHKRILVGVPMGAATQPNQILMLDYTEGFGDPLVAMLTAPERSRKWAPWMIPANSCGLIERSTGVAQIFFGSNNSSGKIYALTAGQYLRRRRGDQFVLHDCVSRRDRPERAKPVRLSHGVRAGGGVARTDGAHSRQRRRRFRSARGRSVRPLRATWSSLRMCWPSACRISSAPNAAGSWFSLTKLVPWAKPDPFAIVRGTN